MPLSIQLISGINGLDTRDVSAFFKLCATSILAVINPTHILVRLANLVNMCIYHLLLQAHSISFRFN
jgi:hypothetical protein